MALPERLKGGRRGSLFVIAPPLALRVKGSQALKGAVAPLRSLFRKNRKRLFIKEAMMDRPILPKVAPPTLTRYSIDRGKQVDGDNFQIYLGVNDNDTIEDVEVASSLAWSTILPRDEKELFKGFPKGEDQANYLVMKQIVAVNAQHKFYRDRVDKEFNDSGLRKLT